jgi:hypothetical protein
LQANAAHVVSAVGAVQVIHTRQQLLRIEQNLPLTFGMPRFAFATLRFISVPAESRLIVFLVMPDAATTTS